MIINIYFYILIAFILPWIISIHYLKENLRFYHECTHCI